jgi:hypothetical protein
MIEIDINDEFFLIIISRHIMAGGYKKLAACTFQTKIMKTQHWERSSDIQWACQSSQESNPVIPHKRTKRIHLINFQQQTNGPAEK